MRGTVARDGKGTRLSTHDLAGCGTLIMTGSRGLGPWLIESLRRGVPRPMSLKRLSRIAVWTVAVDSPAPWPQWDIRDSSEKEPSDSLRRPWDFAG